MASACSYGFLGSLWALAELFEFPLAVLAQKPGTVHAEEHSVANHICHIFLLPCASWALTVSFM